MYHRNGNVRTGSTAKNIGRALLIATIAFTGIFSAFAQDNSYIKFKGAIGVIPVTGVNATTGAVNLNVVRGVPPGAPWRIAGLEAIVTPDGQIRVSGRGLLLAAGNGIGTNAGQHVHASLFCGTETTSHDTNSAGVALDVNGNFFISDVLSPALPASCDNPVLLIRNVGGVWFAAGIRKADIER